LSSSLPSLLLQHPFHGREGASHNHFVTASTPSLGLPMHTEETQTPSVGPVDLDSAMFPAMLTVATSNQLPVHQGASLSKPVCKSNSQSDSQSPSQSPSQGPSQSHSQSQFVTASTPSLGLPMITGETQTPSVGQVGLASVMFPAMLTAVTSNQLPVHQGCLSFPFFDIFPK